jgi:hypothetical protein
VNGEDSGSLATCRYCFGPHLDADCPNVTPVDGTPAPGGLTVEQLGPGRYAVHGGTAAHVVTLTGPAPHCDCPDFAYRGRTRPCKHVIAALRFTETRTRSGS